MDEPASIVLCEDHIHSEREVIVLDWLECSWKTFYHMSWFICSTTGEGTD